MKYSASINLRDNVTETRPLFVQHERQLKNEL